MFTVINIILIVLRSLLFGLRCHWVQENHLIRVLIDGIDMEKLFDCKLCADSDLIMGIFLLLKVKMFLG